MREVPGLPVPPHRRDERGGEWVREGRLSYPHGCNGETGRASPCYRHPVPPGRYQGKPTRGCDIENLAQEAIIHWNAPPHLPFRNSPEAG